MSPLRIGDAERDTAIEQLGEHFAAGRLTQDEFDERATQAAAARFDDDLRPLFADLPGHTEGRAGVAAMAGGWPGSGYRPPGRSGSASDAGHRDAGHPRVRTPRVGSPYAGHQGTRRLRIPMIVPLLVPLFAVAMIVVGAVFLTPWLVFAVFWLGCIASRGGRHHEGRQRSVAPTT